MLQSITNTFSNKNNVKDSIDYLLFSSASLSSSDASAAINDDSFESFVNNNNNNNINNNRHEHDHHQRQLGRRATTNLTNWLMQSGGLEHQQQHQHRFSSHHNHNLDLEQHRSSGNDANANDFNNIFFMNSTSNRAGVVAAAVSASVGASAQSTPSIAPADSGGGGDTMMSMMMSNQTNLQQCPLEIPYLPAEMYCYLFIVVPLATVGIILNLISLKCFLDRSFNSVTFKYLRLITLTDFFICTIIIPYCVLFYTQPFNKYDHYARHLYLAFWYMPGANIAINVSMLFNLLVTIERLISVGWPTLKYSMFKPSRYYISIVFVTFISLLFNLPNFFLYKVALCQNMAPRQFVSARWWTVFGYVRESLTRILPIVLLILFNAVLIYIVKTSRKRMKSSVNILAAAAVSKQKRESTAHNSLTSQSGAGKKLLNESKEPNNNNSNEPRANGSGSLSISTNANKETTTTTTNGTGGHIHSAEISMLLKNQASKRNRQENQLTWMSIVVGILYSVTSLPMVFAYPGLLFSVEQIQTDYYKIFALLANILELIQCSVVRFLIYFCFTTQFREVFYKMLGFKRTKPNVELVTYAENA